jgi:hypothetical protein
MRPTINRHKSELGEYAFALDSRILCNKISKKKESKPRQFQDLFALMNQTGQTLFIY